MLEKLTHEDLLQLTSVTDGPCVSIYIPWMREKSLNLEYEALVKRAQHLLLHDDRTEIKEDIIHNLLQFNPLEYLSANDHGIVLFVNRHWQSFYTPGHSIPEKVVVADSFHLRPLLEDLQNENVFNILTISTTEALFYHCDGQSCLEGHTFLFQQGSHSNTIHWRHQDHTDTFQIPHLKTQLRGRGAADNHAKKKNVKLFLKWIEAQISKEAAFKELPLLVFTSDPLFQLYKESSHHADPYLVKTDLTKGLPRVESLTHMSHQEMHRILKKQKNIRTHELDQKLREKQVVDDLVKISRAALSGQVKTLYIQNNREIWGEFHRKSGEITFHEKQETSHDDDVLDDIACEVLKHGGEVVVLSSKDMPTASPAAAILSS